MKLFIPPLKTKLLLTADWNMTLYAESRNDVLISALFPDWKESAYKKYQQSLKPNERDWGSDFVWFMRNQGIEYKLPFNFKAGMHLIVDRIYIRQGSEGFDSVSFYTPDIPFLGKKSNFKKHHRFWAKLDDVNNMEVEIVT